MIGLHLSLDGKDVPTGKNPTIAQNFLNQFIKVDGNYLATDFRTPGWVYSTKKQWQNQLTAYILEQFSGELKRLGVYEAVRAT